MARVLQTLTIDLTANTANFSAAMTKAQQISLSSTRNIAKSFALVGTAAAAMGTAVVGAVAGLVSKADEYVTQIQRMAEKTGQSTEQISKLAYASALTGGNLDDLGNLLTRFNRSAAESAEGNKKAQGAFRDLGVSVLDASGRFRPAGDLLNETIARLSRMPDSVKKTAVEMDVFGRSGAQLAPVLKVLGTNAAQTEADMKNFGLTLSGTTAAGAEHLAQTVDRGKLALVGMGNTILAAALPALQQLADKVVSLASNGQLVSFAQTIGNDVAKAARVAGQALDFMQAHSEGISRALKGIAAAEVVSFFLRINTSALAGASGIGNLVTGLGRFVGSVTGLGPIANLLGSIGGSAATAAREFAFFAQNEGLALTATTALTGAWESFSGAFVANPAIVALAGIAASLGVVYYAMEKDVAEAEKLGGVPVTFQDQWDAAIYNVIERLGDLKRVLGDFQSIGTLGMLPEDLKRMNSELTFGKRAEQIAQQRTAAAAGNTIGAAAATAILPPPKPLPPATPTPQVAKPDPFKEELAKLNQEVANSQVQLNAAMRDSVDAQRAATEAGKAGLIVTELNTRLLAEHRAALTSTQTALISSAVAAAGENSHNAQVVESLHQRIDATRDALAMSQALTGVVGQGAAAEDAARRSAEAATLAREIGASAAEKYRTILAQIAVVQAQADAAARAQKAAEDATNLRQQAADAQAMATATLRGAAAVEQETLQLKLNAIAREHAGDPATIQALTAATTDLYNAEQRLQAVQRGDAFTAPLQQYQKALQDIARTTSEAARAGVQVDQTQVWMANREAAVRYQESLERIHDATGSLSDGVKDFFTDMILQAQSAAGMIRQTLGEAFDGLNDQLAKLLTGQKTSWTSFFKSMAENFAKNSLKNAEAHIASKIPGLSNLGLGGKADGSKSNPFFVNVVGGGMGKGAGSDAKSLGLGGGDGDDDDDGDGDGDSKGGFLGFLAKLGSFVGITSGGHKALGGSVIAGMAYDVGEQGRERFIPSSNGSIVPNNRLGDNRPNLTLVQHGGVTREDTMAMIQSGLQQYHRTTAGPSAVTSNHNYKSRRPSRAA